MRRMDARARRRRRRRRTIGKIALFLGALAVVLLLLYVLLGRPEERDDALRSEFVTQSAATAAAPQQTPQPTIAPTKIPIDANAGDRITPTPMPQEPGVAIAGLTVIEIEAGSEKSSVALYNPIENDGWYDLTYELRMLENPRDAETGELIVPGAAAQDGSESPEYKTIFRTGLIPPGKYCNAVEILCQLEPGEYDAFLYVQPYRMDENQTPTNSANLQVRLIVK